jgi:hypothetical protein
LSKQLAIGNCFELLVLADDLQAIYLKKVFMRKFRRHVKISNEGWKEVKKMRPGLIAEFVS